MVSPNRIDSSEGSREDQGVSSSYLPGSPASREQRQNGMMCVNRGGDSVSGFRANDAWLALTFVAHPTHPKSPRPFRPEPLPVGTGGHNPALE
jgi:hypothetical protein